MVMVMVMTTTTMMMNVKGKIRTHYIVVFNHIWNSGPFFIFLIQKSYCDVTIWFPRFKRHRNLSLLLLLLLLFFFISTLICDISEKDRLTCGSHLLRLQTKSLHEKNRAIDRLLLASLTDSILVEAPHQPQFPFSKVSRKTG